MRRLPLFLLFAFLVGVSGQSAAAQTVLVNGARQAPGTVQMQPGDTVTVINDTGDDVTITFPGRPPLVKILKPGDRCTFTVTGGGSGPITINGAAGTWKLVIDP